MSGSSLASNGVGKTTTIGKLGKRLAAEGHSVMMAAGVRVPVLRPPSSSPCGPSDRVQEHRSGQRGWRPVVGR
ncbi:MAG: hypothetical protein R2706_04225 [Acidimicrobiales bacterium]